MVGDTLGIILDIALMVMLGVAVFYGVRLNRQVAAIKSGRAELEKLIREFGTATDRAESALADLKSNVGTTLTEARQTAHKAAELSDDLEFLIKRGERVADALEIGVRAGGSAGAKTVGRTGPGADDRGRQPVEDDGDTRRSLTVTPEDRPDADGQPGGQRRSAAKKAAAKSKSELLKALQDMR
ncbi:MAG: DUF6468 domain-containing protein [Alphaproteobacteria bacterium]